MSVKRFHPVIMRDMGAEYVEHIRLETGDWVLYNEMMDEQTKILDQYLTLCTKYENVLEEIAAAPGCPQCVYAIIKAAIEG